MLADDTGYRWAPPTVLPIALIEEAREAIGSRRLRLTTPPAREERGKWLAQLGRLCASSSGTDVKSVISRLEAYANELDDRGAFCFTVETRRAAAKRFKFFPSFAELSAFFDEIETPYQEQIRRLERIASSKPVAPYEVPAFGTPEAITWRQAQGYVLGVVSMLRGGTVTRQAVTEAMVALERHIAGEIDETEFRRLVDEAKAANRSAPPAEGEGAVGA